MDLSGGAAATSVTNGSGMSDSFGSLMGMGESLDLTNLGGPESGAVATGYYDLQQAELKMSHFETEAGYLKQYLTDPGVSQADRGSLMSAYGELNTRLNVWREMDTSGVSVPGVEVIQGSGGGGGGAVPMHP